MAHASLPMYDLAELRVDVEEFWGIIARHLKVEPSIFSWPEDYEGSWTQTGLLLGQTCGLPLVRALGRRVNVIGAFSYRGASDANGNYRAVIVAREHGPLASFHGKRAAINSWGSLSGWASLGGAIAPHAANSAGPFFSRVLVTGSHRASLAALQSGDADIASIDAVTFALISKHRSEAVAGLKVIGQAPAVPCLPLITATTNDPIPIRSALQAAIADPAAARCLERLLISGFHTKELVDYEPRVLSLYEVASKLIPKPSA